MFAMPASSHTFIRLLRVHLHDIIHDIIDFFNNFVNHSSF